MYKVLSICLGLLVVLGSAPAHGENSAVANSEVAKKFIIYLLSHHYRWVPLRSGDKNRQIMEATIEGKTVDLLLDTGAQSTCLTASCARHLHLDVHETKIPCSGVNGTLRGTYGVAVVKSFRFPFGEINRTNIIMVLPRDAFVDREVDGIMGLDFLKYNSAFYPVGGHGILLKPGAVPDVPVADYMSQLNFKAVPLSTISGKLWTQGHINGTPMRFIVDTGCEYSTFRLAAIEAAVKHGVYSTRIYGEGIDGNRTMNSEFTPNQMDVGGLDMSHETFFASTDSFFDKTKADGLIGFDLMGEHRAFVDLGHNILWMN